MTSNIPRQAVPALAKAHNLGAAGPSLQGYKAASEGMPLSSCTLPKWTRSRTSWVSGWHRFHSEEANKEAADGRGTADHPKDPKATMREQTRAMFRGMRRAG